ncbi:DUF1127 domain-containing protein [Microvirga tunisiensis]|uniref:DUF1127 domain-containing protein n=3 Tax=Pannonibacter tanglangensis TaxID=2750084 RepID=A0A7X5J9F5_9HYPH|nr:DUF1127 domain-containing protein [Pannonibacter sp. XCT-34]NBN79472.1 DUF1127 domain-containing protein [Pannonibacter sp. XCT-53]
MDQTSSESIRTFRLDLVAVIRRIHRPVAGWRARARAQRELSQLDERMLRDIGLMRGEDGRWQRDGSRR